MDRLNDIELLIDLLIVFIFVIDRLIWIYVKIGRKEEMGINNFVVKRNLFSNYFVSIFFLLKFVRRVKLLYFI